MTVAWTTALLIVSIVLNVVMLVVQLTATKKKPPSQSQDSQDYKKGIELVTEGKPDFIPKAYGRSKIGGIRVYHNVTNGYKYPEGGSLADQVFQTATSATLGGTYSKTKYNVDGDLYNEVTTYAESDAGTLDKNIKGSGKNEFLYFQQILCQGPINNIVEVIIDQSRYIDDPNIGDYFVLEEVVTQDSSGNQSTTQKWKKSKAAFRVNAFLSGGTADGIIAANFSERINATFDGMTYVSAIVRLDRDNPQFGAVPELSFLIEGSLVRTVTNGIISSLVEYDVNKVGWVYSNNPAWCLLDYLLDKKSGKGVSLDEIDLASFESSAAVCARIVQTNAVVGGKFYQPTDGSRDINTKNIPLYECNLVTDPRKTIRENIESILETMADARLIWANGKYKLSLQYVTSNENLNIALTVTDDNLVLAQNVTIGMPPANQRLNFCTIRFHNEFEEFKEDAVSWPPKYTYSYMKGIGGKKYPVSAGSLSQNTPSGNLLNSYGVWSGGSPTTLDYKVLVLKGSNGVYKLSIACNKTMELTIRDDSTNALISLNKKDTNDVDPTTNLPILVAGTITNLDFSGNPYLTKSNSTTTVTSAKITAAGQGIKVYEFTLGSATVDKIYSIHITAEATGTRALAAKIESEKVILWTTRSMAFDNYVLQTQSSGVYDTMLGEDNGVKLEYEMFSEGISDPYHALAKAEELVRTSRSASMITFRYLIKENYLEPGDYIKINSESLVLGTGTYPLIAKIESIKLIESNVSEVVAMRFDYTQLAWSMKDDVYILPPNIYDFTIPGVAWLIFTKASSVTSSGTLTWGAAALVDEYVLYAHKAEDEIDPETGVPIFYEIGRAAKDTTAFTLPLLNTPSAFFGIKVSYNGRLSEMTYTDFETPVLLADLTYEISGLTFSYNTPGANQVTWSACTIKLNNAIVKNVATGYATWSLEDLYIYYDPVANLIKATTSVNIAHSGKLLLIYKGGTNGENQVSDLLGPIHLYVKGTTAGIFATKDLELTWDNNPLNNNKSSTLAYYLISIINPISNNSVFSDRVELGNNYYKFSYDDNTSKFGSPKRSFKVEVYSVDTTGAMSDPTILTVNNPAPPVVSWSIYSSFNSVNIQIIRSTVSDFLEYLVYKGTASNFVPSDANLVYNGPTAYLDVNVTAGVQYYYIVAAVDTFGRYELIYSAPQYATAISVEPLTYTYTGLQFKPNYSSLTATSETLNTVCWGSFVATHADPAGVLVTETIVAGSAIWTSGIVYLYYIPGNLVLQSNTSMTAAITNNGRILATYKGGTDLTSDEGRAFISGDQILTGSIGANALVTNTAIITNAAQFGNILQSDNYTNTVGAYAGWRIDKTGLAQFHNITIRDSNGQVLLGSTSGVKINDTDAAAIVAAKAAADAAQLDADTAQASANTANSNFADMVNDNKINPIEKQILIREVNNIINERTDIVAKGNAVSSTKVSAYTTAYTALINYLATLTSPVLWSNTADDTTVVRTTFQPKFSDYYTARQSLLNDITAIAKTAADTAKTAADAAKTAADAAKAAADTAQTTANTAQTTATSAATNATTANTELASLVADNKLSPVEKQILIRDVNDITNEYSGILAKGNAVTSTFGTAYTTAYNALNTYLATLTSVKLWNDTSGYTTVARTTFKTKFSDYYTARQNLLNDITAIAKSTADTAQTAANTAQQNADSAYLAANDAQNTADTVNSKILDITTDTKISIPEKQILIRIVSDITNEYSGIAAKGTNIGSTAYTAAYTNAYNALNTYLATLTSAKLWSDVTGTTTIVRATFKTKFGDYYTARQNLLNDISAIAATKANWSSVVDNDGNRPENNATYGAYLGNTSGYGGNVTGQINGGIHIANASIDTLRVATEAITANTIVSTTNSITLNRLTSETPGYTNMSIDTTIFASSLIAMPSVDTASKRIILLSIQFRNYDTSPGSITVKIGSNINFSVDIPTRMVGGNNTSSLNFAASLAVGANVTTVGDVIVSLDNGGTGFVWNTAPQILSAKLIIMTGKR